VRIDILSWLSKATLDIIGLAGFNYRFETLASDADELASAFGVMFSSSNQNFLLDVFMRWFPPARLIVRSSLLYRVPFLLKNIRTPRKPSA
jgi:hypothetical protein